MPTPEGIDHEILCQFTALLGNEEDKLFGHLLAELPLHNLMFAKVLNGPGPWAGTLDVEDPGVKDAEWIKATNVNRTAMWVVIDNDIVYGGVTTGRKYTRSTGKVALTGTSFTGYLSQRLQSRDYTNYVDPEEDEWNGDNAF
jgi:hypothetical protein